MGRQVEALSDQFRCIVWDERGHGMTECKGPFNFWDSARDCLGLLDYLDTDSAVLVGMSQGGFLSMRAALAAPERISGLIIIDSAVRMFSPEEFAQYQQMAEAWTTWARLVKWLRRCAASNLARVLIGCHG